MVSVPAIPGSLVHKPAPLPVDCVEVIDVTAVAVTGAGVFGMAVLSGSWCMICSAARSRSSDFSNSSNWPIKLRLGEMMERRDLTNRYASSMLILGKFFIRYATAIVGDRDTPA